ncbi:hypothetical protein Hte_010177 [Hypoxylon texense]
MPGDFTGLKVIWPPDGTRPPKHKHDIVFVHGLHHGSVSDWHDENGLCWPAENLSLDLGNTRILAFGYDQKRIEINSDGAYGGGVVFEPGRVLCLAIKTARKRDKIQVPLTLIGHGTGGIVIRSALCFSHSNRDRYGLVLQKTKHVIFLDTPRNDLSQDAWKRLSQGSSSERSIGGWKLWSTALSSSSQVFNEIARYFNITSAFADLDDPLNSSDTDGDSGVSGPTRLAHEEQIVLGNTNHRSISQLLKGSTHYNWLVDRIRTGRFRIANDVEEIGRIKVWLGRRLDIINRDDYERNLSRHQPGTGKWLFEDSRFRQWNNLGETSPILWLTGPEGCGKSVLCSVATDRLRQSTQHHATAYLMLAFDKPRSQYQTLAQLALQLLDYVVENQGGVDTEALLRLPEEHETGNKLSRTRDLIRALVSQCPAVFFFIDGLDEVNSRLQQDTAEDKLKEQLHATMSFLVELCRADNVTPVRLWFSSLKTDNISKWMQDFGAVELPANKHAIALDVADYLQHGKHRTVEGDDSISPMSEDLGSLHEAVGCNFLIASMMVENWRRSGLSSESSANVLQHTTQGDVRELYRERLEKLKVLDNRVPDNRQRKSVSATQLLSLLAFVRRPLKLNEVREALAILNKSFSEATSSQFCCKDLTSDDIDHLDGNEIQHHYSPFIMFIPPQEEDKDGYLRLSHVSVLEFLHELASPSVYDEEELRISPNIMSDACLRYLSQNRYAKASEKTCGICTTHESSSGICGATEAVRTHGFLSYAAKYWNRHLDESNPPPFETVRSFLCSSQFITMIQIQSLTLDGHFNQIPDNSSEESQSLQTKLPTSFATRAELQRLADDYQHFIKEWAWFLQLGVTNTRHHGEIQQCFWGALGKANFLHEHGSAIESNASFLLDIDTSHDEEIQEVHKSYFYDTISDDGSRVAVWKLPIQSHASSEDTAPKPDQIKLVRECWYIDGDRPPRRYGPQETLALDPKDTRWDSYSSSHVGRLSLVPILDYPTQVPALNEYKYGTRVRVGSGLFLREKGGSWTLCPSDNSNRASFWEDITSNDSWIVWSRRQRRGFEAKFKATLSKHGKKPATPQSKSNETKGSDSDVDADADASSESDFDESDSNNSFEERNMVSSAEEFCAESALDIDFSDASSQDDPWFSAGSGHNSDSSDESDSQSDAASSSSSSSPSKPKRTGSSITSAASSDADDESSASGSDSDSDSEPDPSLQVRSRPRHQFSTSRYCDICGALVVPAENRQQGPRACTYYQCNPCGSRPWDSYDICSTCFDKGAWCMNGSHLLSKAVATYRDKQVIWEDGISQDAAMPLVNIVAEYRDRRLSSTKGQSDTASFRYTHRHQSMLHSSRPIIHPNLPLLVYPLDGREFLFGNLKENTFFTYEVPFEASETAETSGNTCVPIGVSMRFSSCGGYIYLTRITARNDSPLYGPLRLSASVLTIALSTKDACSKKPRILPYTQTIDLGTWPKLIMQLPYTITWTGSHVYVALSGDFLRVFRFTLHTTETIASITANEVQATSGIFTLSKEVALPRSAQSRLVHFFPSKGKTSAKIVLGSSRGDDPQPPAVVYLKPGNVGDWVRAEEGRIDSVTKSLRVRDDPLIEEPDVDDDYALVAKSSIDFSNPTASPVFDNRFRDWLEGGFRRKGIYCPSCFDLGVKLPILRLPNSIEMFVIGASELPEDSKIKVEWVVKVPALIEALEADCQFCCYVACRLLTFNHIAHTGQFIGGKGPRCCSEGAATEDRKEVQEVLANLQRFDWKVPPEERVFKFVCQPLDQDPETQSFSKLSVRMPSVTVGNADTTAPFIPAMVTFSGVRESGETQTMTTFFYTPESSRGTPECVLELYTLPSDAAHEIMPTRPLATSRGKSENLKVVRGWLEECRSHHSFCRRSEDTQTQLPTRVIEIASDGTAQLVETRGQVGQYVALSYCWGQHPEDNRSTTVYNVQTRLLAGGLPRDELPAAIRDAVTITEELGIKYIWVDAFCIIQDDVDDRNEELNKMSQYYSNSYLTIAASTPRCTMGFIEMIGRCEKHPKNPLPRDLVPLDVFCISRDKDEGHSGKVYAREENPYQLSMEPINRRAWTLQENLLSPRVLFFGSRVIWFCRHMTHSDGGIEDWSFEENELERTRREFQIELSKLDKGGLDDEPNSIDRDRDIYDMWHRIVGTYSQRAMSRPEDKLPAISAVAAEFSKLSKDEYLAGLWRSNLARDLLWTTPDPTAHRPETWRAPTWSWASVDDTILYNTPPPKDAILLATIEEVGTIPRSATVPFGEVERSNLKITAPCFFQNLTDDQTRDKASKPWLGGFGWKGGSNEREMLLEALKKHARNEVRKGGKEKEKFRLPDKIKVAVLYGQRDELERTSDSQEEVKDWKIWGLILKRAPGTSEEENVYERVLSFSQIPANFERPSSLFADLETLHII